jgi:Xaa-Pro aminopeptidase
MSIFSETEYQSRRRCLLEMMEREEVDALIIYSSKPESGYVRYYCGFESNLGIMDCSFLVVVPGQVPIWTLLTNAFWEDFSTLEPAVDLIVTSDFPRVLSRLLPGRARRIGIAPLRQFPADSHQGIRTSCPDADTFDMKSRLLQLRAVKSSVEIELLREIASIADRGGEAFQSATKVGASELEIAAEVEYALRRAGSGPFIFSTLVCSGPRTSRFIALPTSRKVDDGDIVQLDCGPSLSGYHGDFSRALFAGRAPDATLKLLDDTATIYECCLAALKPGVTACRVAGDALLLADELGYGPENLYQSPNVKASFFGHGIGLGNPDAPQLSTEDPTVIEEGMVITIETILRNSRFGSARIEDAVVIESKSARRLSKTNVRLWESRAGATS